jgi:hypothetical protein
LTEEILSNKEWYQQSSSVINITETSWKLADNSIVIITIDELKESLSIQAIGKIITGI